MKLVAYAMIALFVYSGVVQLNDPDPVAWVLVYLGAVSLTWLWLMNELPTTLGLVFAGACLFVGMLLLTKSLMREVVIWDEHMNEPAGLLVIFLWISSLAWLNLKSQGQATLT